MPRRADGTESHELEPGDYAFNDEEGWICRPPWQHAGGNLSKFEVIEHGDRTITVKPSIRIDTYVGSWHGYLEKGIWRTSP